LILSPRAAADLEELADYIAQNDPARAAQLVAALRGKCRAIAAAPMLYRAREDLAPGLRMAVYRRYLLLFRDLPGRNEVRIERVVHGARYLPRLFPR
jgi:toxin ParE1/3/4